MSNYDTRIRDLIAHAYEKSPAIKGIMDNAGVAPADVQSTDDLAKIPVTSKDALNQIHADNPPFGGFLTVDPDDLPRIYVSPGQSVSAGDLIVELSPDRSQAELGAKTGTINDRNDRFKYDWLTAFVVPPSGKKSICIAVLGIHGKMLGVRANRLGRSIIRYYLSS